MKKLVLAGVSAFIFVLAAILFFVPVVGGVWVSCYGIGSASLSFRYLGFGEVHFSGLTPSGLSLNSTYWLWSRPPYHRWCGRPP